MATLDEISRENREENLQTQFEAGKLRTDYSDIGPGLLVNCPRCKNWHSSDDSECPLVRSKIVRNWVAFIFSTVVVIVWMLLVDWLWFWLGS
jgi:hypothetical protein